MEFDVDGALKAGYSQAEIADHLAGQSDFNAAGARKAGYSNDEIIRQLATPPRRGDTSESSALSDLQEPMQMPTVAEPPRAIDPNAPPPEQKAFPDEPVSPSWRDRIHDAVASVTDSPTAQQQRTAIQGARASNAVAMGAGREGGPGYDEASETAREAVGGVSQIPQAFAEGALQSGSLGVIRPTVPMELHSGTAGVARGVGDLAGFIGGAPMAVTSKIAEASGFAALMAPSAGAGFGKALLLDAANQAATLGVASGLQETGSAVLDAHSAVEGLKSVGSAIKGGLVTGALFGVGGRLLPDSTTAQWLGRAVGVGLAQDIVNGTRPWDDRPAEQKAYDYLQTIFFTRHGAGAAMAAEKEAATGAAPPADNAPARINPEGSTAPLPTGLVEAPAPLRETPLVTPESTAGQLANILGIDPNAPTKSVQLAGRPIESYRDDELQTHLDSPTLIGATKDKIRAEVERRAAETESAAPEEVAKPADELAKTTSELPKVAEEVAKTVDTMPADTTAETRKAAIDEVTQEQQTRQDAGVTDAGRAVAGDAAAGVSNLETQRARNVGEIDAGNERLSQGAGDNPRLSPITDDRVFAASQHVADAIHAVTGARPVMYHDPRPGVVDGFALDGRSYINAANLQQSLHSTVFHETFHVAEQRAAGGDVSAQQFVKSAHAIFDMIPAEAKARYAKEYLFRNEMKGKKPKMSVEQALEHPLLKSEMIADFFGRRGQDVAFLKSLARKDKAGFGGFARTWIDSLTNMIAEFKAKRAAGVKDVDQFITDLSKAKTVAASALIEWRRTNPLLADSVPKAGETRAHAANKRELSADQVLSPDTLKRAQDFSAVDHPAPADQLTDEGRAKAGAMLAPRLEAAAAAKPEFDRRLTNIAEQLGGSVRLADVKGEERAATRLGNDHSGSLDSMRDLVRGSLVVPTIHDVPDALRAISRNFTIEADRIKDRFSESPETGYQDLAVNIVMPDGTKGEIQVHLPETMAVKDLAHAIYNVEREMPPGAAKDGLVELQRQINGEAAEASKPKTADAAVNRMVVENPSGGLWEYPSPNSMNSRQRERGLNVAQRAVVDFMNGVSDKKTMMEKLGDTSILEGEIGAVTMRLEELFSAGDIRTVEALQKKNGTDTSSIEDVPFSRKQEHEDEGGETENDSDAERAPVTSKNENLTPDAARGERIKGTQSVISAGEKVAIKSSAAKTKLTGKAITEVVRDHKMAHPEEQGWAPLEFTGAKLDDKGKVEYKYKAVPYEFNKSPETGKALAPGKPEYDARVAAIGRSMAEEVRNVLNRAEAGDTNAQKILAQAGWYKAMRARLRQEFGGLGDMFSDLLGAASPNTPVRDNWTNAVDVVRRAMRGDYDALMPKWAAWADRVDALETSSRAWFNERMAEGLSKAAIKKLPEYEAKMAELGGAKEFGDDLLPTKESGKKYGFNGRNIVRALTDLWRVVKDADADINRGGTAPKALNFSGNLIGFRARATIDVWAARMLQRLSGGKRIPSMAETGVTGVMKSDGTTTAQFGMGQDIFSAAVKMIRDDPQMGKHDVLSRINDDDLQAVVWFVEKELWTVNNWTNKAGEGGSFELEANLTGSKEQDRIKVLRKVLDSSLSSEAMKATSRVELAKLERTVDRYTGGLSSQMSLDEQGVHYVPTNADMVQLIDRIRSAIYESDNGATVLASKSVPTEGRYGAAERAVDLEVVAREGYDPAPLWRRMLAEAKKTQQDSTFLSRVLREDEAHDALIHRPGVEIYFKESASREKLEEMLKKLGVEGVSFLTVITDGRRQGGDAAGTMSKAVGVRMQFIPEFQDANTRQEMSRLSDNELREFIQKKADDLAILAERISGSVEGVSYASRFWHETRVAFSHEYDNESDLHAARGPQADSGNAPGEAGLFRGKSVRDGLESADRQHRETQSRKSNGRGLDKPVGGDEVGASAAGKPALNIAYSARQEELHRPGGVRGSDGVLAESGRADSRAGAGRAADGSLQGLPRNVGGIKASLFRPAEDVAKRYMASRGEEYSPPSTYIKADPERGARIAAAYEAMIHDPKNPEVKAAYDAMAQETLAQYKEILKTGLKVEFIPPDAADPYHGNPRNMTEDVRENNHMWVYSTREGFGSDSAFDTEGHPLLEESGHAFKGKPALVNDIFRAVHDYFGHVKEGVGFRADGEENAWRAHASMYSDLALKAMTTETRAQNSWVNFGPHGEKNRTASSENTRFADQKLGLMPEWAVSEGRGDAKLSDKAAMYSRKLEDGSAHEGYERLNAPRVSATSRLTKLLKDHEAGKLTSEQFADRVKDLTATLVDAKDERAHHEAFIPLERGYDMVRERLIRAMRHQDIDRQTGEFALWALDKNPALAEGLGISIRQSKAGEKAAAGQYLPSESIMTVFKDNDSPHTGVHELMHHAERMMPEEIQAPIRKEWGQQIGKALLKAEKDGDWPRLTALRDMLAAYSGSTVARQALAGHFRAGTLSTEHDYQLVNPSEFWAVNSTRILSRRYAADSWVSKARAWLSEMGQTVKGILHLRSDSPVLRGLTSVLDADGTRQSRDMLMKGSTQFNAIKRDDPRGDPYSSAPDNLMGFRKSAPSRPFEEQNYKHLEFVRATWPDGQTMVEAQRGLNTVHAMERARRNWSDADVERISREEAMAHDPQMVRSADAGMVKPDIRRSAKQDDEEPAFSAKSPMPPAAAAKSKMAELGENFLGKAKELGRDLLMGFSPMSMGNDASRAVAKDYANAERVARYQWAKFDEKLAKDFNEAERKEMWDAADQENDILSDGRTPGAKEGLNRLNPEQRAVLDILHNYGEDLLQRARDVGMFEGQSLPYWTPRMAVMIGADGEVTRAHMEVEADAPVQGGSNSTGDGANISLSAPSLKARQFKTSAEYERAMKTKNGADATLVRDIRTMPMALARIESAIAARELINKVKELGQRTGRETVSPGAKKDFFTLDHPAFRTFTPRLEKGADGRWTVANDEHGQPIMDSKPIFIANDFEGPLRAIMSQKSGPIYQGYMALKGKVMGLIMYSPLIHNAVEWGRALPMMPGKVFTFQIYFEGNKVKNDPVQMRQAISDGLVPIGGHGGNPDATSLLEHPDTTIGKSWTAKVLAAPVGLVSKSGALAVKKGVDTAGNFWHNTMLWDRIGDLQAGMYGGLKADLVAKGMDPGMAGKLAAHWANRFAGALPNEAMSNNARKLANVVMFSRTFTLGNLGAMKDAITGLPKDVKSQILRDYGELGLRAGVSKARRKAIGALVVDIALMYAANDLLQNMLDKMKGRKSWGQIGQGYLDRMSALAHKTKESPGAVANAPLTSLESLLATSENEPGREGRVFVDKQADGTAIYARAPMGKVGEDMKGWMTAPLATAKAKLSPALKPIMQTIDNDDGIGHRIYDPDFKGFSGLAETAGRVAANFMKQQIPLDAAQGAIDWANGDAKEADKFKVVGPLAGVTFSKGVAGGPALGEMYAEQRRQKGELMDAMPKINRALKLGENDPAQQEKALAMMQELKMSSHQIQTIIMHQRNPESRLTTAAVQKFSKTASDESKERLNSAMSR